MEPEITNTDTHPDNISHIKVNKKSPWQFVWVGITLSALLWFTPNIYFNKTLEYNEIELRSGSLSQTDYDSIILNNRLYFLACKIGSSVLFLGSILYLISQFETRRNTHVRHRNSP